MRWECVLSMHGLCAQYTTTNDQWEPTKKDCNEKKNNIKMAFIRLLLPKFENEMQDERKK